MYRTIIKDLINWKNKENRKPLLLTGVRQCGKTYILNEFGKNYFDNYVYFNFERDRTLESIFDLDFNPQRIINDLSAIYNVKIQNGKTLVIFDEIQACKAAISSLKYFCEEMKELHIVGAGSLLGVTLGDENYSFPVGKVERLQLYPMSFYEYLLARGYESLCNNIYSLALDQPLPEAYTSLLEKEYKIYLTIGGMPEVVNAWIQNNDFNEADKILENILIDYFSDFSKYAPKAEIPKLGWIWDSIPTQLAKDNNKFIFSHVKEGKRSADLEDALHWLVDAGLIYKLPLVENIAIPLTNYKNDSYFKVYMVDVGLLRKKSEIPYSAMLIDNQFFNDFKGAIAENYVLNELVNKNINSYFWRSSNTAEIDFIFSTNTNIIPVEVKASTHTSAKSYSLYCERYNPSFGFKLSLKNIGINNVKNTKTYNLPLYLLWEIKKYLN